MNKKKDYQKIAILYLIIFWQIKSYILLPWYIHTCKEMHEHSHKRK